MTLDVQGIGPAQAITELFALVGKVPLSVDSTIVPVVSVGDLGDDVKWGPQAWGSIIMLANPPNINTIEISLPFSTGDSGRRVLIEKIFILPTVAPDIVLIGPSPGLAAITQQGVLNWADTRKRGIPSLLINGKDDGPEVLLTAPAIFRTLANTLLEVPLEWVLGANPDTGNQRGIMVQSSSPTTNTYLSVRFREGTPR